ncbi:MAG: RpiB/LacA/LacB family sugar-phosphate isomerase [Patescibacteria group bacterium]|nr:RpiB/LacA/LacB family sugar-phosphate isomerase [Patescibacteria group bacterium]
MKVYLATDHAGFALKEKVKAHLIQEGYHVEDFGASSFIPTDDYTDYISKVGEAVSNNPQEKGIVFGGSGQAEAMLANKYKGVRCALFYAPRIPVHSADVTGRKSDDPYEMIRLTREHNNANVLSLGARLLTDEEALIAVSMWLKQPFTNEERHVRRIERMAEIEQTV